MSEGFTLLLITGHFAIDVIQYSKLHPAWDRPTILSVTVMSALGERDAAGGPEWGPDVNQ